MEVINNFASSIVEKLIALLTTYPGWIQLLIVLGIAILVLGIFTTVSTTCLYYGVANIQQNQMNIAKALEQSLNVKIEDEEEKYSKMFETPEDDE
jgi:hypothetical protein